MSVSFRLRLTLLSALLSGVVLIVFASAMWWQIYRMRVERITSDVRAYAERESGRRRDAADWQRTAGRIAIEMGVHDARDLVLIIEDGEGAVLYQSPAWPDGLDAGRLPWPRINGTTAGFEPSLRAAPPPPPRPGAGTGDGSHPPREIGPAPEDGPPAPPPESVSVSQQADGRHWRIGLATTNASRVAVAVSENVIDADMKGIRRAILTAMPIALFITGVGAWMFSGRALRPVKELTAATRRVTAAGLDRRISPQEADREFVELITVFNGMLERLERSFKQAYRFSGDAAHELKTPLAILQGQIERAIQSVDQDSSMQAELTSILDEVRRLSAISRKLLLLSQADAGRLNLHRTPFDLSQALSDLLEDTRMLAPHLQVTGEIQPGLLISADGILLPQVLHNLISNAIKYNVDGGWIRISAGEADDQVVVTISNSSIGISSLEQQKMFDRFYRSESARNKGLEGVGLGLSVSREIARAHGGDIALQTQSDGNIRFSLLLPRHRGDKG